MTTFSIGQTIAKLAGKKPGEHVTFPGLNAARRAFHGAKATQLDFPSQDATMAQSALFNLWWYYGVELAPGVVKAGLFPEDVPMLPRILSREIDVQGQHCLDVGSMEALLPVLWAKRGGRVVASDVAYGCYEKIKALQHYHRVDFDFREFGLLYDLHRTLNTASPSGFDLINLSGVLYHVFSPMQVIGSARSLLRPGGLMVVSTNVIPGADHTMSFNTAGRYQPEPCTFWYMTVPLLEYTLRYFQLQPVDFVYWKYKATDKARYTPGADVGYLSVVCRAVDENTGPVDEWMQRSRTSVENVNVCHIRDNYPTSTIRYRGKSAGQETVVTDLAGELASRGPMAEPVRREDSHTLYLEDHT